MFYNSSIKYHIHNHSFYIPGMAIFLKNISFHGILLDALFESKSYSTHAKKEVVRLVNEGIANGTVKPLNSILFNHDQAEQAFRFMASGKHIGKVVLKVRKISMVHPFLCEIFCVHQFFKKIFCVHQFC